MCLTYETNLADAIYHMVSMFQQKLLYYAVTSLMSGYDLDVAFR